MGEGVDAISKHMEDHPDVEGVVIGDESRLRQIITNLARLVFYSTSHLQLIHPPKQCVQIHTSGRQAMHNNKTDHASNS